MPRETERFPPLNRTGMLANFEIERIAETQMQAPNYSNSFYRNAMPPTDKNSFLVTNHHTMEQYSTHYNSALQSDGSWNIIIPEEVHVPQGGMYVSGNQFSASVPLYHDPLMQSLEINATALPETVPHPIWDSAPQLNNPWNTMFPEEVRSFNPQGGMCISRDQFAASVPLHHDPLMQSLEINATAPAEIVPHPIWDSAPQLNNPWNMFPEQVRSYNPQGGMYISRDQFAASVPLYYDLPMESLERNLIVFHEIVPDPMPSYAGIPVTQISGNAHSTAVMPALTVVTALEPEAPGVQSGPYEAVEGGYRCITCNRFIKNISDMYRHLTTTVRHGGKHLECPACGKFYTRRSTLRDHVCVELRQ